MTLKAGITPTGKKVTRDYTGFPHTTETIVEDCIIDGKTFYWGYTSGNVQEHNFRMPDWGLCTLDI